MNTFLTTGEKKTCLGCLACVDICPKKIIRVKEEYGFFYPEVVNAEACIDCGLCKMVCPYDNVEGSKPLRAFAFKNTENIRKRSASGGAFTAISDALMAQGYKVYGCILDNDFRAVHIGTDQKMIRDRMCGSKYVASDNRGIFPEIKKDLDEGKKVLFTGTPCQVSGLKHFLRKDYCNLFTVDFICHGVSSPAVFKDYLSLTGSGSKIQNVIFRDKSVYAWRNQSIRVYRQDKKLSPYEPAYMKMFIRGFAFRDSCGDCPYAKPTRNSDITIGDFWSIRGFVPEMEDTLGVSVVFIISERGIDLLESLDDSCEWKEVDAERCTASNPHMNYSAKESVISNYFWKCYDRYPKEKLFSIFGGDSLKSKLIRKSRECIATAIRKNR